MLMLYDYYRSSACYRVRIALHLKNIPFEIVPIHLVNHGGEQFSEKYSAINPQQLVPALKLCNERIITQSLAILNYLDKQFPTPALYPNDPYQSALAHEFALIVATDMHPLNNLRVLKYLIEELHVSDENKMVWYHHWLTLGFQALEKKLQLTQCYKDFCFGQQPTIADICLVPQLYNARRFGLDLTPYQTLTMIEENCNQLAAFRAAAPEKLPQKANTAMDFALEPQ